MKRVCLGNAWNKSFGDMPTILEVVAVFFTGLSVWLTVKNDIRLWPTGIIGVLAFLILFIQNRLYSDAILQVIFLIQSVGGWMMWHVETNRKVTRHMIHPLFLFLMIVVTIICSLVVGQLMTHTNAALPYWDASILIGSIIAQTLLMFSAYENWYFWIAVNLISIGVYFYKGLYLTGAEYIVFLGMCIQGVRTWRKELVHV
jgi:nicotinamide mononucleotide transporter